MIVAIVFTVKNLPGRSGFGYVRFTSTPAVRSATMGRKVLWPISHGSAALERRLRRSMTNDCVPQGSHAEVYELTKSVKDAR